MAKTVPRKKDLPVTQGMFMAFKDELLAIMNTKFSEMNAKFHNIDGKFASMDSKFASMDGKFASMDGKFTSIDSRFASIDSKLSDLDGKYHRLVLLMEEQRNDNVIALDAVRHTMEEMIGVKTRVDKLEKAVGV